MPSFASICVFSVAVAVVAGSAIQTQGLNKPYGYTLPANLTDGAYMASLGADGQQIHVRLPDIPLEVDARSLEISTRQEANQFSTRQVVTYPNIFHCGCGYYMDHGNCDAAVQDMKNQLGSGVTIPSGNAYYSIRGNAVAFVCTRAQLTGHWVDAQIFSDAAATITTACGWYVAGTIQHGHWGSSNAQWDEDLGYMQYTAGLNFCGNAEGSPASSC